jgi:membrane-bound metal-dependent hydrolase YbcI (DUF457 family)
LFGVALARRLGIRSPFGLAIATVAASLPDADVIAGAIVLRDPWKWHRKTTHTLGFAIGAGMLAGAAGVITTGSADGTRDVVTDTLVGALLVGSHIVLDNMWFPYVQTPKGTEARGMAGISAVNWLLDALIWSGAAWLLWPKERRDTSN